MKCTEAAVAPLRRKGLRLATYIDDWLLAAQSEQEAREHTRLLTEHLSALGFRVNIAKSVLTPTQTISFIGLTLDSFRARLSLAMVRIFWMCLAHFQRGNYITFRLCLRLLGLMASVLVAVQFGCLYMREFQRWVVSLGLNQTGRAHV